MKGPPKHYPKSLDRQFASDPFDPRMRRAAPSGELTFTALGLAVELWRWTRLHPDSVPPALAPVVADIETLLRLDAPDALEFLEKHG